jgi:hypothetical protein
MTKGRILPHPWYLILMLGPLTACLLFIWLHLTPPRYDRAAEQRIVSLTGLGNIAVAPSLPWIRHRSLSDLGNIFQDDPQLANPYPAQYIYTFDLPLTAGGQQQAADEQ